MPKPYKEYKQELHAQGKTQDDLAEFMGLSTSIIRQKLNRRRPWKDDEMYKAIEFIGKPDSELSAYLPRNGGAA